MSTAQFGGLLLDIAANTAQLQKDMDKATRILGRSASQMDRLAAGIKTAIGAAVGAASVRAFGNFVQGALDGADALSKMSQKTGIAVETLSGLKHAASLSDVSMDQLATGLKLLSKNATEAAAGGKEQTATFKAMGIDVRDAGGNLKPVEVLLGEVADRFASYQDGAAKSALAQRVFGKAGADLIPLLNGGSAGLAAMREEAERLGIVVSTETARAAERFNDNMTRVKSQLDAVALVIGEAALPSLERLSQAMSDAAQDGDDVRDGLGTIFKGAIDGALMFTTLLGDVGRGIGALGAMVSQFDTNTWQNPAFAFWNNWVGDDSAWMRSVEIMKMWQDDSLKAWDAYWNQVRSGGAGAAAAGLGLVSEMPADAPAGAEFGMSWVGMPGAPKGSAPIVRDGKPARLTDAAKALKELRIQLEQFGMTDKEIDLANFKKLEGANPTNIKEFAAGLAQRAENEKKLAAYSSRSEGKIAVQDSIAAVGDQADVARQQLAAGPFADSRAAEYAGLRASYYAQSGALRTAEDDAAFERRVEQLRETNRQLDLMRKNEQLITDIASRAGSALSSMIVAPLRDGFKGLTTIIDILKQAIIDLVEEMASALIKSGLIKLLSTALNFVAPGAGNIFGSVAGAASAAASDESGSGGGLVYGKGWGNGSTRYATGGKVFGPGGPRADRVRLNASPGEWMIQQQAAAHYGDSIMSAINRMAIPRASLAWAMGGGGAAPGAGRDRGVTVYAPISALSPKSTREVFDDLVSRVQVRRYSDRSASLETLALARATRPARDR
jgi:hypothetical protein